MLDIVSAITKAVSVVSEIANASQEQARDITNIQKNIENIYVINNDNTGIVQSNLATSEELASQAETLQTLIQQFTTKEA